jgi:hypothetical protein
MSDQLTRREFVKGSATASTGAAIAASLGSTGAKAADNSGNPRSTPATAEGLPTGKLGDLQVSRLLLGGNLLTHYTHSRDLKYVYSLAERYNTEEKILETLALAEANGINTLVVHNVPATMGILKKYRERGGKMQWITCTFHALAGGDLERFVRQVEELVDHGTDALYISGVEADSLCGFSQPIFGSTADQRTGTPKLELLAQAIALCKAHGLSCGVGAHRLGVIEDCEKAGIDADFYVKTFHGHDYPTVDIEYDSRWCSRPEDVIKVMANVSKPWIAFKVMAAGAILPKIAFQRAFDGGADFVLAGMFDFEIEEDVRLATQAIARCNRPRPWHG